MKNSKKINYLSLIKIKQFLFFLLLFYLLYKNSYNITINKNNNKSNQFKYFKIANNLDYIKLFDLKYFYSFKYKIIKFEYNFEFYESNNTLVLPSDITLYKNLHFLCHIESYNSNSTIKSFPDIVKNRNFKCIEYININEIIKVGINLYETNEKGEVIDNYIIFIYSGKVFNYSNLLGLNDKIFDPLIINGNYLLTVKDKYFNDDLRFHKSYIQMPKSILKNSLIFNDNQWNFGNIFNEYFCFCKGLNSFDSIISQKCKYFFYLNLIDKNRKIYSKTDILFVDFIFDNLSSDDSYPIFKEMMKEKLPVHYLTESSNIYNEYCYKIDKCQAVIPVNKLNYTINGDFLEKYLTLILRLKQVISNSGTYFNFINNLFYNIEYITYISVTHGVCYFKYFLYQDNQCYGFKKVDKILIPPSEKIFSFAIKLGWKSENIIKLNLPKWDNYNEINNSIFDNSKNITNNNNSILIIFTWREVIKNKRITSNYLKNIFSLILTKRLIKQLKKNNITLYFALHHKINEIYKHHFTCLKYIKFIPQNSIADCIKISNLFITDFSSIIFDFVYRKKPFIIYVPDYNDYLIKENYKKNYYELIQSMKNGTFEFENIYFNIDLVVNKIIFYINNNFQLEETLKIFYQNLNLNQKNNKYEFIKYIKNIN